MKKMKRRELLAGLGIGTLLGFGLGNRQTKAADAPVDVADLWQYAKIDPLKAADLAYEIYPDGACMYAVVKALLTTIADAQSDNPLVVATIRDFPFHMMRYGHGGIGATGGTCGAFNGGAAVIGLYVKDAVKRDAMIQELAAYYEHTALPKYKPKDDQFPTMHSSVSDSLLCHISSSRWRTAEDAKMFSPKRVDRCKRLSADMVVKTAELLNRYFQDKECTFAPLMQPTATCFDCHGPKGAQADIIGTSSCAACHEHDEKHSNKYINMQK